MASFQDIQDRVERRVIDLPSAVTAEIPGLINRAMRRLQDRHDFKVMETETAQLVTTVATHTLATVPSNFKSFRNKPYEVENDGETRRLLLVQDREEVLKLFPLSDTTDTGAPRLILDAEVTNDVGDRSFEVYPFTDSNSDWSNGEYRIVIPYWRYLTELSAGVDTNWFTVHGEDYLVFMSTAEAFYLDWDENRGSMWEQRALVPERDVTKIDKMNRLGAVDVLSINLDVNAARIIE